MNEIKITSTVWVDTDTCSEWDAQYEVTTTQSVTVVVVFTGYDWLEIVVAKYDDGVLSDCSYCIAVLDGHTAAFRVSSLTDTDELFEALLRAGLRVSDAITVAQILSVIGEGASENG